MVQRVRSGKSRQVSSVKGISRGALETLEIDGVLLDVRKDTGLSLGFKRGYLPITQSLYARPLKLVSYLVGERGVSKCIYEDGKLPQFADLSLSAFRLEAKSLQTSGGFKYLFHMSDYRHLGLKRLVLVFEVTR